MEGPDLEFDHEAVERAIERDLARARQAHERHWAVMACLNIPQPPCVVTGIRL